MQSVMLSFIASYDIAGDVARASLLFDLAIPFINRSGQFAAEYDVPGDITCEITSWYMMTE